MRHIQKSKENKLDYLWFTGSKSKAFFSNKLEQQATNVQTNTTQLNLRSQNEVSENSKPIPRGL